MPMIEFLDFGDKRKKFKTDKFKIVKKSGRNFAVAIAPSGVEAYRIVSAEFARKNK